MDILYSVALIRIANGELKFMNVQCSDERTFVWCLPCTKALKSHLSGYTVEITKVFDWGNLAPVMDSSQRSRTCLTTRRSQNVLGNFRLSSLAVLSIFVRTNINGISEKSTLESSKLARRMRIMESLFYRSIYYLYTIGHAILSLCLIRSNLKLTILFIQMRSE